MWKAVRDGVNLHEESESEPESEPYGGDRPAAVDHSVGSGRRRVWFLHGFGPSPPLALAASKQKTPMSCATRRDRVVRPNRINQASAVPTVWNSCEGFGLVESVEYIPG